MIDQLALRFMGAADSTTGSRHLLEFGDKRILLDCGLYQGRRAESLDRNAKFGFEPASIHSVLLSHAHIDHSGNLPSLVRQGFGGNIYCTGATEDLCKLMLMDSAYIQEKDAEFLNKRARKRGDEQRFEPLYSIEDAERCLELFQSVHYHREFRPLKHLGVRFYDAGHILGSAGMVLELRRGERVERLGFSGDIGRVGLPLLRDPEIPHDLDWLIMESTYGARHHAFIGNAKDELNDTIVRVAARGGKIIIPSFSVERTQELIYYLNELYNERELPPVPVYIDSPLAIRVTDVFRMHPECYDRATLELLTADDDVFGFQRLNYVRTVEESKALNSIRMPCIIISASGMCEAGRIRHHLANSIENPKNCVLFVGFQAEHTLGRRIVERQPVVRIFGREYNLRAEVVTLNAFSGHADQNDLVNYARTVRDTSKLRRVFLVHGESEAQRTLAGLLTNELGLDVHIPQHAERVELV